MDVAAGAPDFTVDEEELITNNHSKGKEKRRNEGKSSQKTSSHLIAEQVI